MKQLPALLTAKQIRLEADGSILNGDLMVPTAPKGLVVFVHGSGSGRFSPRNRLVADWLTQAQVASLLIDLLTDEEEKTDAVTSQFRFDIPLLARRTTSAVDWTASIPEIGDAPLGLFGASTGAAAALIAAAERPTRIQAVVSRGGRADLAGDALERVIAPTLLIVGSRDTAVMDLNRRALGQLTGPKALKVVPGATHLFDEPGALNLVSRLATDWFVAHFA